MAISSQRPAPVGPTPDDVHAKKVEMVVARVVWQSDDGTFAIIAGHDAHSGKELRAKGPLCGVTPGEALTLEGKWKHSAAHGYAFTTYNVEVTRPRGRVAIQRYLEHALHGVGPVAARKIVDHFGDETLDVIDTTPEKLLEIPGIGEKKLEAALQRWAQERATRKVMMFLKAFDITSNFAMKIYREYGDQTIAKIEENPYILTEMHRIGFKKADAIALQMGVPLHDRRRIRAGIVFVIREAQDREGHCYLPLDELLGRVASALDLESLELIDEEIKKLAGASALVIEISIGGDKHVYAPRTHRAETRLCEKIRSLIELPPGLPLQAEQIERPAEGVFIPTDEQWSVMQAIMASRLTILRGGPGTGKSSATRMIVDIFRAQNAEVAICAPTGKAAKRATELSGHTAKTIHRLLEWRPQEGFTRNAKRPLDCDLLIVDETSMVDLELADRLFAAIGNSTHVLLVGDTDQLPPVGMGKVMSDIITSGVCPAVTLTQIFRQAAKSMIIQAAYSVNRGKIPSLSVAEASERLGMAADEIEQDFFWVPKEDNADIMSATLAMACHRIPRQYGLDAVNDVQIIAPQRTTAVGVDALNRAVQQTLNPKGQVVYHKPQRNAPAIEFRLGDKLLQTKNDYEHDLMNGEFARLLDYDPAQQLVMIEADGREVTMGASDMADTFTLAYAATVHKMQGSSAKAVVIPLSTSHFQMLFRNLLYTAITRAEQLCVLIGPKRALGIACRSLDSRTRFSDLAARLQDPSLSGRLV